MVQDTPQPRPVASRADAPGGEEVARVRAARTGDRRAFAELFRQHAPAVHGVLLSLAPAREVDDLLQEVFLAALRGVERLEADRFGPWLMTIARNKARDHHKRLAHRVEVVLEPLHEPPAPEAPDLAARETAGGVLRVLRGLPEAYRETLTLRLVEGLGGPEIAAATGLTPGSVRVNLHRGMKLLRERLALAGLAPLEGEA